MMYSKATWKDIYTLEIIETEEEYIERLAQEDQERRWIQQKSIERKNDAECYKGTYWLGSITELIAENE
jgi:hypothetical protein